MKKITLSNRGPFQILAPSALLLFFFFNLYLMHHFAQMFGAGSKSWFILGVLAFFSTFGVIPFIALSFVWPGPLTRILNLAAVTWMAFYLLSPFVLAGFDIIYIFKFISAGTASMYGLLLSAVILAYGFFNARRPVIREIEVPAKGITKETKLVMASDLHLGPCLRQKVFFQVSFHGKIREPRAFHHCR